jgi:hypothetical protein
MKFAVESWAPDYGGPAGSDVLDESGAPVDVEVEVAATAWAPRSPSAATEVATTLLFVDGVRRVDARVWITCADGTTRPGICATYAAGIARCDGRAEIIAADVRRAVISPAPDCDPIATRAGTYSPAAAVGESIEELALALQQRMGELEVALAVAAGATGDAELVVIDGPLTGRQNVPGAVGYVKTHHVAYLPPVVSGVVAQLAPGQRTPLFLTTTSWSRWSWYLRLPGAADHPWAGVVRCEATADVPLADAIALADRVTATLPRFASTAYKDPRAPQNLVPVAGLERELRRRLGDAALIERALRAAASVSGA